jgi:hypothetical protein
MSVGDVHSQARGSGARFNSGKAAMELIPLSALTDCARVFDYGRAKYAAWNWAKGMDWSIPYACAIRHLSAWFDGEDNDPESGQPHLGHVMCNLVMLSTFARTFPEGDDRPQAWLQQAEQGPSAAEIAHKDGHTATGAGIIDEATARAIIRDRVLETDDDLGPPSCATGECGL